MMNPEILHKIEQGGTSMELGILHAQPNDPYAITDEYLIPISEVVSRGEVERLELFGNEITTIGCDTIATMLRDTNSNLQKVNLHNNDIGLDGAYIIANSLHGNTKLKILWLSYNRFSTNYRPNPNLQNAFVRLLCNTDSINDTYLSNHTLEQVTLSCRDKSQQLKSLLELNKFTNKSHVAIKKILQFHPNIDMKQLFGWDSEDEESLKALPYVISWFSRAKVAVSEVQNDIKAPVDSFEYNIDQRKLSAIYQFARYMPLQFISNTKVENKKRKRIE